MTAHPSATTIAKAGRYIENVFLHARGCSRRLQDSYRELTELEEMLRGDVRARPGVITDAVITHENIASEVVAAIAPAAIELWGIVETAAPGFEADMANLKPEEVDRLIQPLFQRAGIGKDFMPAAERFPKR